MFNNENMPYILLGIAIACALYYFFVYKKQTQEYKEESKAPEKADPSIELYEDEPYEEEAYVEEDEQPEAEKKSK